MAAIIPCVQHRRVTPPAWGLSKARRGTGTELLRSMRPSQGARSNTGATLHHAPCTPGLTHSLDQHHTGTGKYSCRSSGKGHEADSNPESRFCTRTLAHNSHCSARHPREMYDLLDHKRISFCKDAPRGLQAQQLHSFPDSCSCFQLHSKIEDIQVVQSKHRGRSSLAKDATLQACYALPRPLSVSEPTLHAPAFILSNGNSTGASGRHDPMRSTQACHAACLGTFKGSQGNRHRTAAQHAAFTRRKKQHRCNVAPCSMHSRIDSFP